MLSTNKTECRLRDGEHPQLQGEQTCESSELTSDKSCGCPPELLVCEQRLQWFAIRVTYSREMRLKAFMDERGVESFLPMHYIEGTGVHAGSKQLVPVIHNLLFVHSNRATLDRLKNENLITSTMRYMMDKATHKPIVVPEDQMRNFIAVSGTNNEQLVYLSDEEVNFRVGDSVRITGGPFAGVEGELLRIKGDRRVVVKLDGFCAVATAFIHPSMLEKLKTNKSN